MKKQPFKKKKVTFEQFWAAIQRIQTKQILDKLIFADIFPQKQTYSYPPTILDYLIKSCHTKLLFNLSKTCKELKYFTQKIRGRAVGYLIIGEENCNIKADIGISTCVNKTELKSDLMLICNYENSKYLKNIVCEGVLEIYLPKHGSLIQKQKLISDILNRIKKLQHTVLNVLSRKSNTINNFFTDSLCSLLLHENLTEIDLLSNKIPLKYLSQLKNCTVIKFSTNFKDDSKEETESNFASWKPQNFFTKFVIQIKTAYIPQAFINFITESMAENSVFAITVPEDFTFENFNIPLHFEDDEILHSIFCHRFGDRPRSCFSTIYEIENSNNALMGYQILFGAAEFCNDILVPKNFTLSCNFPWKSNCALSLML